ncbi:alpha-1,2-mannosyltransferase [Micromonospora pattaloongensis]|uniref:Alpha-1,2-mannosyltransferase n=1 Tax=Micromonospora pattaloongensis TaxID=405436 RepID=A0A1H3FPP7_9ACTN|nr:glycosyltransferase 87 family protein [Micromonospora pattaloongensis]SDX92966.1 alpha-1,2-mannosyltransferase [Micromonospora pattaloongensis]
MPAVPAGTPTPAPTTTRAPRSTGRWFAVLVALAVAGDALVYRFGNHHDFFDLRIYISALRWWAEGNPLYDYAQSDRVQGELYFTYPPFAALLLRPFAALPLGVTITAFTIGTLVAIAVTTRWLVIPLADRRGISRWWMVALAVPLVVLIEPSRETINFGQINMLLVVLILADLLFAVPRKSRWAGVGIGLATALKLFPGIFIVYLLVTRRWRAAMTAAGAAAAATLLAAAFAPRDSWQFWTHSLWATERVGRTDYTGNQSLQGLLSRLVAPEPPNRLIWLALVALVLGYGLWRAGRAARAGDEVAALTLTGLVGALVSPITWTHHIFWFVPALVVLADAALPPPADRRAPLPPPADRRAALDRRRRAALLALATLVYVGIGYGVVSFHDWGAAPVPTDSPVEFVLRNVYVLLALALLVLLPVRGRHDAAERDATPAPGAQQ